MNEQRENRSYFAAANGYKGFRSNFDRIFSPLSLNKMFVIKGGPGTGKSTLMKKIATEFEKDATVTRIYCSSDPESLDGLIIEKNEKIIGIADGTAPHVIEPTYPGAKEEIINLADGFDYHGLYEKNKEIITLAKQKKREFEKAYSALEVAGSIRKHITAFLIDNEDYSKAECIARSLIVDERTDVKSRKNDYFLISAFCKSGHVRLNNPISKRTLSVHGDNISEYILMSKLKEELNAKNCILNIHYSPLSDELVEAIETEECYYIVADKTHESFDSSTLIKTSEEYNKFRGMYLTLLEAAKKSFNEASIYHFELEKIYSQKINFENNALIYKHISQEINYILNK